MAISRTSISKQVMKFPNKKIKQKSSKNFSKTLGTTLLTRKKAARRPQKGFNMVKVLDYVSKFYVGEVNSPQDVFDSTGKPTGQGFGSARKGPQVTGKVVDPKKIMQ